jgi:hypothetical protein
MLIILPVIAVLLTSCSKENELKESVFIYDPENFDLPEYSEWGYNTFGAYYDREIFVSNDEAVPAKITVSDTSLSFLLEGEKRTDDYNSYYNNSNMLLTFTLPGSLPEQFADLAMFNDSIIDLADAACQVFVTIDTMKYEADILEGELNFKRVQILQVDKMLVEAILSGYFDFKAIINGKPITVSDGRFDVGIGRDNFYEN